MSDSQKKSQKKGQAAVERTSFSARSLRGQAAVEYLMTYGWAILALIIILVIVITSGVLSPSYLVSQECNLGSNMFCNFILYNQAGNTQISLDISNGFSYKVKLREVNLTTTDKRQKFTFKAYNSEVASGDALTLQGTLSGNEIPDNTIKRFVLSVTYAACSPELAPPGETCSPINHTITGRLTGRITVSQ